jgi:2-isopropylmalate synthase
MRVVKILDTTLRDGEQSPGCSMDLHEKLEVASMLEALRVDIIEAGFAVTSPDDFAAVKAIAETVKDCSVASLCRAVKADIDRSWEALRGAVAPRLHVVLPTSPVHMRYNIKLTPEEVLAKARESVAYAKGLCPDVQFSAEDAGRSERPFLAKVFAAAIEAGATVVNVPDTVGYLTPAEMADLIQWLLANTPGIENAGVAVHCHNDLGMAAANSLAAVKAGAAQVECTLNGIGERAGNASLEEIAMAIKTRALYYGAMTNIRTKHIYRASRALSAIIGVAPPPNKPVVGANAFAHESGIHQNGVLQNRETYEIMRPEDIGIPANKMVLGKHSGRHALEERLAELGFSHGGADIDVTYERFKLLADRKKLVSDDDIIALVAEKHFELSGGYTLERFIVLSGTALPATATVKLSRDGAEFEEASTGDGPINAAYNAIDRIAGGGYSLADYSIRSVTEGEDAQGEAIVKLRSGGELVTGRGLSTDIIEASIKAYLNGINKLSAGRGNGH